MSESSGPSPAASPSGSVCSQPGTHAPKYGTIIPNRIFVGGIAGNTQEQELKVFFSQYGAVKDTKIIADRAGVSKGYGFVTFETQEDAERIIKKESDNLLFKDRKLNIGPAIRKQPAYPRIYTDVPQGTVSYINGIPYTFHNGCAIFQAPEGGYPVQPQHTYPVMVQQPTAVYQPPGPQYYAQTPVTAPAPAQWTATAQWRWAPPHQTTPAGITGMTGPYIYQPDTATIQQQVPTQQIYTHPGAPTYQHPADMTEAPLMEAAPAEGSMHNTLNLQDRTYAEVKMYRPVTTTPSTITTAVPVRRLVKQPPQTMVYVPETSLA